MRARHRLVKSQRLDIAAEFAQRVEAFRRAGAGIGNEIVESIFASDHDKMRDAAGQSHSHDDGISAGKIRIDQLI